MKHFRNSRLWWLLFVSLPLLCPQPRPLSACIFDGSEGDDLRFFLFRPDLAGEPNWMPYYYTKFYYFGKNPFDWPKDALKFEAPSHRDEAAAEAEWLREINDPAAKAADLHELLFQVAPDSLLQVRDHPERRFGNNSVVKALRRPGREALWEYLLAVKSAEHCSTWDYEWGQEKQQASALQYEREQLLNTISKRLQAGRLTPFLQARYAFVALRLAFYAGERGVLVRDLYQRYLAALPDSAVLHNWALHYVAQINPDSIERTYQHAMVFDRCDSKKLRSHQLFTSKFAEGALKLAKNNHEKVAILALRELNNPGQSLAGIRRVLALVPGDRYVQLLVGREVNKIEDWLFTLTYLGKPGTLHYSVLGQDTWETDDDYYDLPQKWHAADLKYLRDLRQALVQALPGAGANSDFLRLAIAQLYLLDGQAVQAKPMLQAVRTDNTLFNLQQRLLQFQLTLQTEELRQPAIQEHLAEQLHWLDTHRDSILAGSRTYALALSLCAAVFEQKGMPAEANLLRNCGDLRDFFGEYTSPYYTPLNQLDRKNGPEAVRAVLQLIEKPRKTAFEQLLAGPYQDTRPLYDLLGTMYMRAGQVDSAYATFSRIPDTFWSKTYDFAIYLDDDPFTRIDELKSPSSFEVYNKKTIAARLLELEKIARTDPSRAAECYLQLGNAWYNFSYYGNSWMMLSYYWSSNGSLPYHWNVPDRALPAEGFERNYSRAEKAAEYYRKALQSATESADLQAQAAFMLAHIDMLQQYRRGDGAHYTPGSPAADYYHKYRQTDFYRQHPCSTIEDFMRGK